MVDRSKMNLPWSVEKYYQQRGRLVIWRILDKDGYTVADKLPHYEEAKFIVECVSKGDDIKTQITEVEDKIQELSSSFEFSLVRAPGTLNYGELRYVVFYGGVQYNNVKLFTPEMVKSAHFDYITTIRLQAVEETYKKMCGKL